MPKILISTNTALSFYQQKNITNELKKAIELIPGEKGEWLMTDYESGKTIHFGDDWETEAGRRAPCGAVEISILDKVYNRTGERELEMTLAAISLIVSKHTAIPENRLFVFFRPAGMWAFEGKNIEKTLFSA